MIESKKFSSIDEINIYLLDLLPESVVREDMIREEFINKIIFVMKENTGMDKVLKPSIVPSSSLNLWNNAGFFYQKFDTKIAIKVYENLYEHLQDLQRKDKIRYHKGMALHNLGISHIRNGERAIGLMFLVYAMVEDVLTEIVRKNKLIAVEQFFVFNVLQNFKSEKYYHLERENGEKINITNKFLDAIIDLYPEILISKWDDPWNWDPKDYFSALFERLKDL